MNLPIKELLIAVIENDNSILMRKKPMGSLPYKETWYLFGCERIPNQDDLITIKNYLKSELSIEVEVDEKLFPSDSEIKKDHDGIEKKFIYTNFKCHYLSGAPKIPTGIEKVEWIPKDKINEYDIVSPSIKLLKTIGYLNA